MSIASSVGSIGGSLGMKFVERKWAKDDASTARHWNENMSNTAHQREVRDLRAAGLNPILSAKYGGASTSAAPQTKPTTLDNPVSAFMQNQLVQKQVDLTEQNGRISSAKAGREEIALKKERIDYENTYGRGKDSRIAGSLADYPNFAKGPLRTIYQGAQAVSDYTPTAAKSLGRKIAELAKWEREAYAKRRERKLLEGLKKDYPKSHYKDQVVPKYKKGDKFYKSPNKKKRFKKKINFKWKLD